MTNVNELVITLDLCPVGSLYNNMTSDFHYRRHMQIYCRFFEQYTYTDFSRFHRVLQSEINLWRFD